MGAVRDAFYAELGLRVQLRRKAVGLTQRRLAQQAGVVDSYIARIEAGRCKPTLDTLRRIARMLHVDLSALLADTGRESWRAEDRRLAAAARTLDTRDLTLLTALVERWAAASRRGRR